jgi:uncharacterized protein (DUF1330 family)
MGMAAYFVLQIDWSDPQGHKRYLEGIQGMIEKHGGHLLVTSTELQTVEGRWEKPRLVIIEFPSKEALLSWYDSSEYRPMLDLRLKSSQSNAVVVEGVHEALQNPT